MGLRSPSHLFRFHQTGKIIWVWRPPDPQSFGLTQPESLFDLLEGQGVTFNLESCGAKYIR